ncbi:MAG: PHP domain-containing protein [Candidatus Eisenbacteria bacterium]|uniref:PHP domain-containing protein n=1 Tax=Eiseniibacteriota bacterium TaxID=2212470 RepID=A0A948W4R0_UNCEI|nr:PHP domain-containing protein [Candidatus Eisenbacteria bacterium]
MTCSHRAGADLHLHTYYSDGWLSPRELVLACVSAGLEAVALTDHDTVKGLPQTRSIAEAHGLRFVPAVELSVNFEGRDLHILAYYIDPDHEQLSDYLKEMEIRRRHRIEKIVGRLQELGVSITVESVFSLAPETSSIGRPHVAQALLKRRQVSSFQEAFTKYLGTDAPVNIPKETATLEEAMSVIIDSGGCAVLAHPGFYNLDKVLPIMEPLGLTGIEVYHPSHTEEQIHAFAALAARKGLIATGGSDFHRASWNQSGPVGSIRVPCSVIDELKARAGK